MNKIHFSNVEGREVGNVRFMFYVCFAFLCFINVIMRLGVGNIQASISVVAMVEITVGLLLYFFLWMLNMVRKDNGYRSEIKEWSIKSRAEKGLFFYEFIFVLGSYITCISMIEMFCETDRVLEKVVLYSIIIIVSAIMRISSGYNKMAGSILSKVMAGVSIGVFMSMCVYVNQQAWDTCTQKETFVFDNSNDFKKCKTLYNSKKPSYVVIESGNNTVQVRGLTDEFTELYFAKSESDFKEFIKDNTMGIGVDVPVLSGNCSFDDEGMEVTYEPVFCDYDLINVERDVFTKYIKLFLVFESVILIVITVVANKREKE